MSDREREEHWGAMSDRAESLASSDKGRAALRAIYDMAQGPAGALDQRNQGYAVELLQACWGEYAGTTRDAMRLYLGEE